MSGRLSPLFEGGRLNVELLEQLHRENSYCLVPIAEGKRPLDLDGDQVEVVTEVLRLARFGDLVRQLSRTQPRQAVEVTVREASLRLSGAMPPPPGED